MRTRSTDSSGWSRFAWLLLGCAIAGGGACDSDTDPSTASDDDGAGGTDSSVGPGASGGYDAGACHEMNPDIGQCLDCCAAELPGKSADDYYDECEAQLTPTSTCPEWYWPCVRNRCSYAALEEQDHCYARVACEEECDCERCGGDECVDFVSDGQNCGSCGHVCSGTLICVDAADYLSGGQCHAGTCYHVPI